MDQQEFVQDSPKEDKLDHIINIFDYAHYMKSCLNYGECVLKIEIYVCLDLKTFFDCIISFPTNGAVALKRMKDLLVYLRDDKNDELKNMYSEKSTITAPILYYLLSITLEIRRVVTTLIYIYTKLNVMDIMRFVMRISTHIFIR